MEILSKLPERLKDLIFDKGITCPILAKELGIGSNTITRYLQGAHLPQFEIFISLIEYFHCSADFLLGRSEQADYERVYLPTQPFCNRFRESLRAYNISQYALQKATKISWNNIHHWLNGTRLPYLDSLCKIADYMDCSVDYLLGRTN